MNIDVLRKNKDIQINTIFISLKVNGLKRK